MTPSAYADDMSAGRRLTIEKYVRITGKRQITIPKEFYDQLRMGTVLHAWIKDGRLVLEPLRADDPIDFAQEIINDLADSGLTGAELKREFSRRREGIMAALKALTEEGRREAQSIDAVDGEDFMAGLLQSSDE